LPTVQENSNGRFAIAKSLVKRTTIRVKVTQKDGGTCTINGYGYDEFRSLIAREVLLSPLIITGLLGRVNIEAEIIEGPGGNTVIPRAIRHATSQCIAVLYPDTFEKLRLAGLLTADPRRRERSKINQPGARSKWKWQKR